tara:strand:+ start:38 stop:547 length:510 start_codon:yes stop_codon:yes gene_type:complete
MDYKSRILAAVKRYETKRDKDRKTGEGDDELIRATTTKKKKPKSKDPDEWTERQIQTAIATILNKLNVVWCHVPNEGKRDVIAGSRLRAAGLKSGVPDILIFEPAPNMPAVRGVAIELKRKKGGRLSDKQREWLDNLKRIGWHTAVCKGYAETILELERLGYIHQQGVK